MGHGVRIVEPDGGDTAAGMARLSEEIFNIIVSHLRQIARDEIRRA
jgi:hypothetical protein